MPVEVIKLLMAFGGFLIGSFVPLALLYLVVFVKRHAFNVKTILGVALRILMIPVIFIVLVMIIGLFANLSPGGVAEIPPEVMNWFAAASGLGLLGGIVAFLYGLAQGIRSARQRRKTP